MALAQEDAGLGGRGRGAGVPDLRERVSVSTVRIVSDGGLALADGGVKGLRGQGPAPVRVFRSPRLDGYPVGDAFVLEMDVEGRLRRLPYVPVFLWSSRVAGSELSGVFSELASPGSRDPML